MASITPQKNRLHTPWFWLLLIWMAIIFSASGDAQSMHRSSRLVEPLLQWLMPHASPQTVGGFILLTRKAAHLTEYAIMAALLYMVMRPAGSQGRQLDWALGLKILALLALYAISDEFHQTLVPNRYGSSIDVIIDVCGGWFGLLLIKTWQKRRPPAPASEKAYRSRDR